MEKKLPAMRASSLCADLKKRGVTDIFIACHDNLTGLCEAINSIFPETKNQLCIVHRIRSNCKFVPYKDRKSVCADLKKIYGAINLVIYLCGVPLIVAKFAYAFKKLRLKKQYEEMLKKRKI